MPAPDSRPHRNERAQKVLLRRRRPRPRTALTLLTAAAILGSGLHVILRGVLTGAEAFSLAGLLEPDFMLGNALPALLLLAVFGCAALLNRRGRHRAAGLWFSWGIVGFTLLMMFPRGVHAAGWYLQPLLVLLMTCVFGAVPGLIQASLVVFGLLCSAALQAQGILPVVSSPLLAGVWVQAGLIGGVVVAMALCGALLHRTLNLAILAEEDQLARMDEAMRALRHREHLLRHAMRVETVGEVSSMVVHQLRNQLQLIMGYAGIGIRKSGEEARGYFQSIVETLGQSGELLESLLGMARREGEAVARTDLVAFCQQVTRAYEQVLPSNITIELDAPEQEIPIMVDVQGLEHALLNLVINARQAIEDSGRIILRLRHRQDEACLEVCDTGCGISEEHLASVFKPFFTTKEKGRGTGLGLAAVQRFVTTARGQISVDSRLGVGTTFRLNFPIAEALTEGRARPTSA